jgi:peptide/nickel transport system permease protein
MTRPFVETSSRAATSAIVRHPALTAGALVLGVITAIGFLAPLLGTSDPMSIMPSARLRPPSPSHWFGTDMVGRDIYSRVLYGARTSIIIGVAVAALSLLIGLVIGLFSGFIRWLDFIVGRIMDGFMAIPAILLAISLIAFFGGTISTVVIALSLPEVPRVVRLIRSVVLSVREEPYVEAAIGVGTPLTRLLVRHVLPNCYAPLIVQGTYIAASAMLLEAILSFLGLGLPPTIPSWGSIMADGRPVFQIAPWIIFFPGIFLAGAILAINILGDGLRDILDPRFVKRV